jgi:DMSO/TMAO reductase YedYZ molybdopterin-dependent catalytic subunit
VRGVPGVFAGLIAGLVLILVQVGLRIALGVSPPPEAIPDRFAPMLSIAQFFRLLDLFGGYDQLKQFGVGSILAGELGVAMLVGVVYARLRNNNPREAALALVTFVAVASVVTIAILWPVLGANFRGLPQATATWLSVAALIASYALFGLVLVWAQPRRSTMQSRRTFVRSGLATAALGIAALVSLKSLFDRATFDYDGLEYRGPELEPIVASDRFYSVTKNVVDPDVDHGWWRLEVRGLVDRSLTLSLDDLMALPGTTQETTLMCISNYVGGGLISNAVWRGVPLHQLLGVAGPRSEAVELVVHGADGYTDTIGMPKALDGTCFIAYGMNDEPLPARHGGPARLLVPGRFGEKSVKWMTAMEVVDRDVKGFYEQQGWGPKFVIPTRSQFLNERIDARSGNVVDLRGWAFAGDRGISRVDVSSDGGRSWQPARVEYPGTRLTWALWRLAWQPTQPGDYQLVVRAVDAQGELQTDQYRDTTPDGATGYHAIAARVSS